MTYLKTGALPKLLLMLGVTLLVASVAQQADAQELKKFNNPYIYDGIMWESPFQFTGISVSEVRVSYDKHKKPKLDHFTKRAEPDIVKEWRNAYENRREVSPGILIVGHVHLTQVGHWAFTMQDLNNKTRLVVQVVPQEDGKGSILRMDALRRGHRNSAYGRSWMAYSPYGLEPYSVVLEAR